MLTLGVNGVHGAYKLNLPTSLDEISKEFILSLTDNVKVAPDYTLIGIVYRERLYNLIIAASKSKKTSNISVIPIFVKAGATDSSFVKSFDVCERLIVSGSDIMMGYHVSTPNNPLTIDNVVKLFDGDLKAYQKTIGIQDYCYFIEFKIIPNCNIHGSYLESKDKNNIPNPYVVAKNKDEKEENMNS